MICFDEMVANIKLDVVKLILHLQKREEVKREQTIQITKAAQEALNSINFESSSAPKENQKEAPKTNTTVVNNGPKVGRNDLCPCRKPVRSIRIAVAKTSNINAYTELKTGGDNIPRTIM